VATKKRYTFEDFSRQSLSRLSGTLDDHCCIPKSSVICRIDWKHSILFSQTVLSRLNTARKPTATTIDDGRELYDVLGPIDHLAVYSAGCYSVSRTVVLWCHVHHLAQSGFPGRRIAALTAAYFFCAISSHINGRGPRTITAAGNDQKTVTTTADDQSSNPRRKERMFEDLEKTQNNQEFLGILAFKVGLESELTITSRRY
jgi:hypothetical protein